MKKTLFVVLLLATILMTGCIDWPENSEEVYPFCEQWYENEIADGKDYPRSFIGACVSHFQTAEDYQIFTGNYDALVSLCGSEDFRAEAGEFFGVELETRQECIRFGREAIKEQ